MALKLPVWFWTAVVATQRALSALLGLKSAGVLENRTGVPDFKNKLDK